MRIELQIFRLSPGTPKFDALGLSLCKGFLGAHGNELPLNLGRQPQYRGNNRGLLQSKNYKFRFVLGVTTRNRKRLGQE